MTGAGYRLELRVGDSEIALTRDELLALPQRTAKLPIACVEGWTTTQEWTGVPLAALAERAGAPGASEVLVESLQPAGVLRHAALTGGQIARRRRAAGAEGQRRGPLARPRLPGADHRPRAARRAQHQVGGRR